MTYIIILTGIACCAAIVFYFLQREKKIKRDKKDLEEKISTRTFELMKQKYDLVEKNRVAQHQMQEFTDSLKYAVRLQAAILPEKNYVQKLFPDCFVLYLPKDIVSGDFYFAAEFDNKRIIAAADCTGHGVSGAFMSMIGNTVMSRIIKRGISRPDEILNELQSGLNEVLKQQQAESHDGMDICLCVFDDANSSLEFAGANRPLWLVRGTEMLLYKPDKSAIGSASKPFNRQSIAVQKGDAVYLFSDGYADQFGGMLGKKLMTRTFKEILIELNSMTMNEQGRFLKTYINKYRGELEQVDDILVIGIRL